MAPANTAPEGPKGGVDAAPLTLTDSVQKAYDAFNQSPLAMKYPHLKKKETFQQLANAMQAHFEQGEFLNKYFGTIRENQKELDVSRDAAEVITGLSHPIDTAYYAYLIFGGLTIPMNDIARVVGGVSLNRENYAQYKSLYADIDVIKSMFKPKSAE